MSDPVLYLYLYISNSLVFQSRSWSYHLEIIRFYCMHICAHMMVYNTCWNLYFYFSPHYFKHIKVSALALLKMVMHSRSGGNLEVMGLLLGKVDGNTMIVMDSFALPVEGTETRVNAQAQAYEYMAAYTESAKQVCQKSNLLLLFYTYS